METATARELAKDARNPFTEFVVVPVESVTGFRVGPRRRTAASVDVQPLVPFSIHPDWHLIVRPLVAATYVPAPDAEFGFEDLQTSVFLTPAKSSPWVWGVGPVVQVPTATSDALGTGKWSAGPTGALIYSEGPWLNGVLAHHLASFAGSQHRDRVSSTYLEPLLSYNFESGWYVQCDPAITYDWNAPSRDAWTVPVGADVGKALKVRAVALALQLGAYDFVKHPDGAAESIVRAQVTFFFPAGR